MADADHRGPSTLARWYAGIVGVLTFVAGLVLAGGGVALIIVGGSWYYLIAGLGLIGAGALIATGSLMGVALYVLVYLGTLVWALWEAGLDGWPLVPRLGAPTVALVLIVLTIPVLSRMGSAWRRGAVAAAAVGLGTVGTGLMLAPWLEPGRVVAQTAETPFEIVPEVPVQSGAATLRGNTMAMLETGADWPAYGGTYHAMRYSPLAAITPQNVGQLEKVWEYRTGDMPEGDANYAAETTPLVIDNVMYLCSAKNVLISIDAETGLERWRHDPVVSNDAIPYSASCRGVAYYEAPDMERGEACAARVIEGTLDGRLIAVDADTGQPCADFGNGGVVDLLEGIGYTVPGWFAVTSPPTIVRGVVVIGHQVRDGQDIDAPSGVIRGYDAITGELAWAWDMGRPGETGLPPEGETYTRGSPNFWTIGTGDEELGLFYAPMGVPSVDYYGSLRSELQNQYSTAIVALDVATGQPRWHFQTVYYDVWDYDLGSQGTLVDFPTPEGPVPALILPTKQGDIYVLDRATGEPLVPVEEGAVPQGGVEPENLSPVQPFSTYHTVKTDDLEARDMWGMSPFDQLWCRIQYHLHAYEGIFTPPTADRRWIQFPGYNGGSDWGGISVDPERGIIIANYNITANSNRLVPREEADELDVVPIHTPAPQDASPPEDLAPQAGAPYAIDVNAGWRVPFTGLLCTAPPYGGIRAIELATGDTLWDRPFGTARKNGPFGIPSMLPFLIGTPNNAGPILTATGLAFIGAATDDLLRAIDVETGEVLWQVPLPAGGQATPITYEANGRQFVVIMAGGHHFMGTPYGDYVLAYALPE